MRIWAILVATTALAACSGGGPQTASSTPPPATPNQVHSFVTPLAAKTYVGIGGSQVFQYSTDDRNCCGQQAQTFAGNATSVRNSSISIAYDPRDAIFTLTVTDPKSGADTQTRFQDPASRTDFSGTLEPQWGTPNLNNPNIRYLQAGDGDPLSPYRGSGTGAVDPGDNHNAAIGTDGSTYQATSFFYEVPGSTTKYVTYAGYVRNSMSWHNIQIGAQDAFQATWKLERGAFAYGEMTAASAVPKTGSGSYTGAMLATMVYNPTFDGVYQGNAVAELPTFFQWISGTSKLDVDFGASTLTATLNGTVFAPQVDYYTDSSASILPAGTTFTASGTGRIDLVNAGGFIGVFNSAGFTAPGGGDHPVTIAGSSLDGAFYGPAAEEIGGGFRIVGGTPDQRIDILGAFTGKK
ncbi:transferrin-binding protein-like solute binding protein [Sphingomonas flavalba]|uniref:transferrin-binding protein-like solute binding protein n=1 Tax=Sphingomonas flavalba TaxID=2559804 RepID=UPI00109DC9F8|nr:transferrin-binding protein-like solute binding protein [Sphingomonas flavalba]